MALYSKEFKCNDNSRGRRQLFEGGIYHVIQRSPGNDILFLEKSDYLCFLRLLKQISKEFTIEILCFCLMNNHVHILLKINKVNLSQAMKSLFMQYAMDFNKKYSRKGHVFHGKYKSFLCYDDNYLITASVYIHLNPYKANLVEDPFEYRWSSLKAYYYLPEKTFLNYGFILDMLDKKREQSRYEYRKLIEGCLNVNFKNIVKEPKDLKKNAGALFNKVKDVIFQGSSLGSADEDTGKKREDLSRREVKKRIRTPEGFKARRYQIEQLLSQGYKVIEIAEMLNISRQSVYNVLRK
jgi:putative transposase